VKAEPKKEIAPPAKEDIMIDDQSLESVPEEVFESPIAKQEEIT